MTPAQRLLAAADLLDKRAREATAGPWMVERWEDFLGKQISWSLPSIERWRGISNDVQLGEDEATTRYIATMHPEVGKEQAAWLRESATDLIDTPGTWTQHTLCARFIGHPDPTNLCRHYDRALAIADLILAGES